MIKNFKILHFLICALALILLLRFNEFVISFHLISELIKLITIDPHKVSILSMQIFDQVLSFCLFSISPLFLVYVNRRANWLKRKCDVKSVGIILIITVFLYAPLLAPFSYNLQFNLPISKNLAPLSQRYLVETIEPTSKKDLSYSLLRIEEELFREFVSSDYFLSDKENRSYTNTKLQASKILFIFGTDEFGRDIFSRMIFAIRYSLFISMAAICISAILGIVLGFISGYYGNYLDIILNRVAEIFFAIPFIFLVILFVAFWGESLINIIIILGTAGWMSLFKVIRGEVLKLKAKDHIITSRMIGMTIFDQLNKEYIPLLLPIIIVNLTFQFAYIIVAESSLSFLGVTGNYSFPSLGGIIQQGYSNVHDAWWILLIPFLFIAFIFYIIYEVADSLRYRLSILSSERL